MNFRIATLAAIAKVDEQTVVDASRLFGYRRVGHFLCIWKGITPAFIEEVLRLQRMKDAADSRRNKRGGNVTQPSV